MFDIWKWRQETVELCYAHKNIEFCVFLILREKITHFWAIYNCKIQ